MAARAGWTESVWSIGFYERLSKSLSLYAQHIGWLHSRPKRHEKETSPPARIDGLRKDDPLRDLPECDEVVLSAFIAVGRSSFTGEAHVPITWSEVESYSRMSGAMLTPWEANQVINMSRIYCSTKAEATNDPMMPPPYMDDSEEYLERTRKSVSDQIKRAFSSKAP